jgi:DNA-binding NarL/FixJ family response regulator
MRQRNRSRVNTAHPGITGEKPYAPAAESSLPLTTRQLEIARHIVVGRTAREIAMHLALSRRTVESHIDALKLRLDCANRCQLTAKLVRLGIELDE